MIHPTDNVQTWFHNVSYVPLPACLSGTIVAPALHSRAQSGSLVDGGMLTHRAPEIPDITAQIRRSIAINAAAWQ